MFYFHTEESVLNKSLQAVFSYNSITGQNAEFQDNSGQSSIASIGYNTTTNKVHRIVINSTKFEHADNNKVFLYAVLHEIGHGLDAHLNYRNLQTYHWTTMKDKFPSEVEAWKYGIMFGLQNGFIEQEDLTGIKKFMKWCLDSYNNGKHNTIEAIEDMLSLFEGGK